MNIFMKSLFRSHGRYVYEAAVADASGLLYVPPAAYNPYTKWFVAGAAAVLTISVLPFLLKKKKKFNLFGYSL